MSLKVGDSKTLTPVVTPEANLSELKWTSLDSNIATVDDKGTVKAVAEGSTKVVASVGTVKAECTVNVAPVETEKV